MNTSNEPWTGDEEAIGPWGRHGTILYATTNEIRFLSRIYNATFDNKYKTSALKGLKFIFDAQTPTGGWPKSYPVLEDDYHKHITFNDGAMINALILLKELITEKDYAFLDEDLKREIKERYELGIDCILKCQIRVNGELTAWCQQHDETDYRPRSGRSFEPAAISGGESAQVLLFLMSIRDPSPEVIMVVKSGVKWYHDVQIDSMELIVTRDDQIVKYNPAAPPLWARFYEIGTNKPVFCGRDGIIRYDLAEIEPERRRGYKWYNHNGTKVFDRYEEWCYERKWDKQPPTNIDESKVGEYILPDPLHLENGKQVKSTEVWEQKRRQEILKLFEQHQHGRTPSESIKVSYEIPEHDVPAMGGMSHRTQVRISFPDHPEAEVIRVLLNVPANAKAPVPTLLHISFSPNVLLFDESGIDEGMAWDVRSKRKVPDREAYPIKDIDPMHFIKRGYGIATVYYGDIEPDFDHGGKYGVRSLFPGDSIQRPDDWGAMGAWSWGLSRIMDYLETEPDVDAGQVALSGVSRLGKAVLWAAAQNERFAMVIPLLSGEGGAAISRRNYGETIADLTNPFRYDYWYAPRYADYAFKPDEIPVDGHMLLALITPRPVLQIVGSKDTWSDPRGEWVAAKAAEPVYTLYGLKGPEQEEFVEPGIPILNDMGFYMHDDKHTVLKEDFEVMTDFMDRHFTNQAMHDKVTVIQDEQSFTLSNGMVAARVSKESGDLVSFTYKGIETITDISGHPYVYWSHDVKGAEEIVTRVTIDPADNDGQMAEVSVKGISGGRLMGHGPGTPPEGDLPVDIEIRYTLSRADQGIYTYCIFEHKPEYDAGDMAEARIAAKLQPFFDHIHIDEARSGPYPLLNEGIDKYVYTALQARHRAYGFTSPEKKLGWFMIIPSAEFLSGGPNKAEFLAHGTNPTVLCYWKSSHYGGANITLSKGEEWSRVVGPLLLYVNEGPTSEAMWHNAEKRLRYEETLWPYEWVRNVSYDHGDKRTEVTGQFILVDSLAPKGTRLNGSVFAGLTKTPYTISTGQEDRTIHWQNDAKNYQYWVQSENDNGRFSIHNVPAGSYTLTAFADGILGEFTQYNIVVPAGGKLDLGEIHWTPVRHGRQVWDIGIANRTATEFAGGDSYFRPGSALRYAEQFPDDINYVIGESDFSKDWYYAHMPHADDSLHSVLPFRGVSGKGKTAPRTIHFQMDENGRGRAFLRIAVSGTGSDPIINLSVNEKYITQMSFGIDDRTLLRHQVHGIWREMEASFDASMLHAGMNSLTLEIPAGSLNNGVIYDYIRLELEEK